MAFRFVVGGYKVQRWSFPWLYEILIKFNENPSISYKYFRARDEQKYGPDDTASVQHLTKCRT